MRRIKVRSTSDRRKRYTVVHNGRKYVSCSCPGWIYYHQECKHLARLNGR